jgi:glycosyltransferase involved in cell wall biosynthesis
MNRQVDESGKSDEFCGTQSIIIPAYNEQERIGRTIKKLIEGFPQQEILVVCDGQDNSKKIVRQLSSEYGNVRLIKFNCRLGKGGALIHGFRAAKGEAICFVDADESVGIDDLKSMFLALHGSDGIIASRRLSESKILIKQPIKRRLASKAFNILVRLFFGLPFKDTQCGAKIFRRDAILDILDDLETTGFEIDVEILWRLKNKGYKVVEYPITWKHSDGSKFKLSQSKGMLISLLKVRFSG